MKLLAALSVFAIFCSLSQLCHSREKNPGAQQDGPVPNEYITKFVREDQLLFMSNYLIDYAHLHGALFIDTKNPHQKDGNTLSNHFSVTMPMTVFPSPYPDALFKQAQGLQKLMAELHLRVSRDYKFISDAMKLTAEADPHFIGKLVKIMDAVHNNRRQSGMTLILQRSDYLTHLEVHPDGDHKTIQLKQIESTGGNNAGQGDFDLLSKMHQRMVDKVRYMADEEKIPAWVHDSKLKVPKNEVIQGQAEAIFQTWLRFSEMHGDPRAVILLISAPKRRAHSHYEKLNMTQFRVEDIAMAYEKQQREAEKKKMGENTQQKYYRPHLVQITIKDCAERLYLKKDDHHLILKDEMGEDRRVAIAYFMDGYLPKHFQSEAEWKIRLEMEQSEAVIQPNIFVYFAGSKTVQQALTEPGALARFFPEAEPGTELANKLAQLRGTFIQQWALGKDDEEEKALVKLVMAKPHDYVLKSNRQGGKGTFFDQEIVAELGKQGMTAKQRGEFVVQKKIKPFYVKNLIMPEPPQPETQLDVVDVNSELSIFGALLAITKPKEEENLADHKHPRDRKASGSSAFHADQHIVLNTVDGYGVRTKVLSNKMCTISGGLGGLDSLVPLPMEDFLAKSQSTESGEGKEVESCAAAGGQFAIDGEEKGPAVPT